jgi:16S rRNA (cytidine1402-2'-O)-methyltransferase
MTTLYIVATPIGNLEDISMRALRILGEVDFVLCEDTRVTQKLLSHYNIKTQTISYHQHSDIKKIDYILDLLAQGKDLALVSDAGTPGISDPGGMLVQAVTEKFGDDVKIE